MRAAGAGTVSTVAPRQNVGFENEKKQVRDGIVRRGNDDLVSSFSPARGLSVRWREPRESESRVRFIGGGQSGGARQTERHG